MAEGPASASKKPPEKDSTKPKASEDAAEDLDEDPFFRSEIDDLLTVELETVELDLLDQATTSDEGLETAGTLSRTSNLPVDIEEILQETERIVHVNDTHRVPSVATSGRKTGLQSKSSQKPVPVSRRLDGENQQSSVAPSSAVPADNSAVPTNKDKKKPRAAKDRGAFVPKVMEGQEPNFNIGPVATTSSAPAAAPVNQPRNKPIPGGAKSVTENRGQGKVPAFKPLKEAGKAPKPAMQSAGLFSASEMASPATTVTAGTISSPTVLRSQNWAAPSVKGGQNALQRTVGGTDIRMVSSAAQPQSRRESRSRRHSIHRRRSHDGHSSSTDSSYSSDDYPHFNRRRRRNSRQRERRRRSSDSVYSHRRGSRANTQATTLGYPEPVVLPQVGGYPQAQNYPQVPDAYLQQAPAYSPRQLFPTTYGQPPASGYAANPAFPPGYSGPPPVDPIALAGVRPYEVHWGPSSYAQRYGPKPVAAPARRLDWSPWQPGPFEPRY